MMAFYLQLASVLFALLAAHRDKSVNTLFIRFVPPAQRSMKWYHRFGGAMFGVVLALSFTCSALRETNKVQTIYTLLSCGLLYWGLFNYWVARLTDKDPFHLGEEAWTDRMALQLLKANAGKELFIGCLSLTLALNVAYCLGHFYHWHLWVWTW